MFYGLVVLCASFSAFQKCVLRGAHDQHSFTQLDRIMSITIVSTSITTHMSLSNSRALT